MEQDRREPRLERRLAAILAADVAGYSRLMGLDEEGTLRALKGHRTALVDPTISAHHGRVVKTTGDGMLVEFASAVHAVHCAVDLQRGMLERNAEVAPDRRIEFRVGINVGDIIVDGDDIYGDGVNIAARLEAMSEPGGICVSRLVRDPVRDKLALLFEDMGEQSLKNIARPVRVYRVRLAADKKIAAEVQPAAIAPSLPDKPSLAVLPFQNMTGDPDQEYFVDGMVEEITTGIAHLGWLFALPGEPPRPSRRNRRHRSFRSSSRSLMTRSGAGSWQVCRGQAAMSLGFRRSTRRPPASGSSSCAR